MLAQALETDVGTKNGEIRRLRDEAMLKYEEVNGNFVEGGRKLSLANAERDRAEFDRELVKNLTEDHANQVAMALRSQKGR